MTGYFILGWSGRPAEPRCGVDRGFHRSFIRSVTASFRVERMIQTMSKPKVTIDPQPRTMDMIFRPEAQQRLAEIADLTVFDTGRMPAEMVEEVLPESEVLIGQTDLPRERLNQAPKLRAIFNVKEIFFRMLTTNSALNAGSESWLPAPPLRWRWLRVLWVWRSIWPEGSAATTVISKPEPKITGW
jgi:hypothetical protein